MAIQIAGNSGVVGEISSYKRGMAVSAVARAPGYCISNITGVIGAAAGANSTFFVMRIDPAAGASYKAYVGQIRLQYTTIVAFTTPVTAGRRLVLHRGAGAAASAGTSLPVAPKKDSADGNSQFNSGEGGDMRIATTGTLTVTGITFEPEMIRTLTLSHVGTAGASIEALWEFRPGDELVLNQGELLGIRNPVSFDAAGTWQLSVNVDWYEGNV